MIPPTSSAAEWRAHWPLVLTCFLGMALPVAAIQATGVVMQPLIDEFGWSRSEVTIGVSIASMITVPFSPFVGAMVDRWGVRRIALPGVLLAGLATASIGLATGSVWQWMALWTLLGLTILVSKSILWTTAIASTFTHARSTAISIVLSGSGMATIVVPPLAQYLTDTYSWRHAFAGMGLIFAAPVFVLSLFFLFDVRDRDRRDRKTDATQQKDVAVLPGLTVAQALRCPALYRIGLSTLIAVTVSGSLIIHKVPLLSEAGLDRQSAALLASLTGAAAIAGKLGTGWLMDRFDAGWVGAITNFIAVLALACLLSAFRTPTLIVGGMMMLGYSIGTGLQICASLTSVHAGLLNFGKVYGTMASVVSLAGALGPMLASAVRDLSGGYDLLILVGIPMKLIAGMLLVGLGAPPDHGATRKTDLA